MLQIRNLHMNLHVFLYIYYTYLRIVVNSFYVSFNY